MLPHGFVEVVNTKSPLIAILLIFSVALPVLERKMFLALLVPPTTTFPNANDDGVSVTTGPAVEVTVSWIVVVCVSEPDDTPVIVTVDVPVAAFALAVKVSVLVVAVGFGANPVVTPFGSPEALKVTLPLKPFDGTTVMVLVFWPPCATLSVFGFALRLKSGPGTTFTTTGLDSMPLATTTRL